MARITCVIFANTNDDTQTGDKIPTGYDIEFVLGGRLSNLARCDLTYTTATAEGFVDATDNFGGHLLRHQMTASVENMREVVADEPATELEIVVADKSLKKVRCRKSELTSGAVKKHCASKTSNKNESNRTGECSGLRPSGKRSCHPCSELLLKSEFSKTQWKKPRDGQMYCINCHGKIASMGPMGRVLKNSHSLSSGIVDGRQHLVHGNIRWDRAIRSSSSDREIADKLLAEFKTSFDITKATVTSIKKLGKNEESYVRFQLMQNVEDHGPISEGSMTDFLTTVRTQRVHHIPFQHHPEQSGSWPINTFTDSPSMSTGTRLKFRCKVSESQYISSFPEGRIVHHVRGTVLKNNDDMIIGARCYTLNQQVLNEMKLVYDEIEKHRPFLTRGNAVANVCANFAVTGLKQDNNTKLLMTHVPRSKDASDAYQEMQMRSKLRGIFVKNIYPLVQKEFGWLFDPITEWVNRGK